MRSHKLKGIIDDSGNLIIPEKIDLPAGEVEVILLEKNASIEPPKEITLAESPTPPEKPEYRIKALKSLLENAPPLPPDFDPDRAKWEYLKEKHNL